MREGGEALGATSIRPFSKGRKVVFWRARMRWISFLAQSAYLRVNLTVTCSSAPTANGSTTFPSLITSNSGTLRRNQRLSPKNGSLARILRVSQPCRLSLTRRDSNLSWIGIFSYLGAITRQKINCVDLSNKLLKAKARLSDKFNFAHILNKFK